MIFRCKPLLIIKQWESVKSYKISKRSLIHNTIRLKSIMISTTEAGTCQPLLVHYIQDLVDHLALQKFNRLFNGYNLCIAPSPHKFIIVLISGFLIKVWIVIC